MPEQNYHQSNHTNQQRRHIRPHEYSEKRRADRRKTDLPFLRNQDWRKPAYKNLFYDRLNSQENDYDGDCQKNSRKIQTKNDLPDGTLNQA